MINYKYPGAFLLEIKLASRNKIPGEANTKKANPGKPPFIVSSAQNKAKLIMAIKPPTNSLFHPTSKPSITPKGKKRKRIHSFIVSFVGLNPSPMKNNRRTPMLNTPVNLAVQRIAFPNDF